MPGTVPWTPIPSNPQQPVNAATVNNPIGQVATALQNHENGVAGTRHLTTELDTGILDDVVNLVSVATAGTTLDTRLAQLATMGSRIMGGTGTWAARYAAITPGTNDLTTLSNAISTRTALATASTIAYRDVDAGTNLGHVAVTGQNVARIVGSFLATPGAPGGASVFAIGATAVGDIMLASANKSVVFGGAVTAPTYAGTLANADAVQRLSHTPGTKLNYAAAPTNLFNGQAAEWAFGTNAAPVTSGGSLLKASATFAQPATVYGVANAAITEASAGLSVYAHATAAQGVQIAGLYASVSTDATAAGADAVAVYGIGISSATSTRTGFGAYFQGQRNAATGGSVGMELRAQNESGIHSPYTTPASYGGLDAYGINYTAGGTGGFRPGSAIAFGPAGSMWTAGIVAAPGSVYLATFDDGSSSQWSQRIGGSHTYGTDYNPGTFAYGAIRLGDTQGVVFRNHANTADLNGLSKTVGDQIALAGGKLSVDSTTGAVAVAGTITSYPPSLPSVPLTDATGHLVGSAIAAGTIPVAAHAPGYVSAGPAAMQVTVAAFPMVSTTGAIINAAGGPLTLIAPTTTNFVQTALIYADNTGTPQVAYGTAVAANPTPPSLPASARAFATVLVTQGMTTITQSLITQFRDMNVPLNANAAGGAPGADTYVVITADPANLPNAVTAAALLGGGNGTLGNPLAALKPTTTDATLNDLLNSRYLSPYLHIYLGFSGSQVSLGAGGSVQHTVYINGKLRTITSTITSVSMAGSAAGTYFVYADVSAAGVSTFTLAISALNTNSPTVNQANIGAFYWTGTAFQSDLNTNANSRAIVAQVQPKIVNANHNTVPVTITNAGAMTLISPTNFPPYTYATSGSMTYYFNGLLMVNAQGNATVATAVNIQMFLNGTPIDGAYAAKTISINNYEQIVVPCNFALGVNQVNNISFGVNSSASAGWIMNGAYLRGTITGGV